MYNIKQKFEKLIISFCCLFILSACESTSSNSGSRKNIKNTQITEVAILAPLSGENEVIGKQYIGLIKMGLADGAKSRIRVTSYDSSDEMKLKESITKILEQKINIIIGPIYSKDTKIVSAAVKGHDVTVLSLSNDPTLADRNIFVFGHAPMRQMEQITNYLLNNDYKNYITLLPSNRYSQTVSKIVQNIITSSGGTLSKMEFYGNSEEELAKALGNVSHIVDNINEQEESLKQPVILMGDDPENLTKLFSLAKQSHLDKKAVIAGDNRLDIEFDQHFNIIYTGSIKVHNNNLKDRAVNLGVKHFSFMHALAYDAGKIVASYIGQNYTKEAFLAKLSGSEKFEGVSGNVHFIDSIAQRQYEIIKKHEGTYSILKNKNAAAQQDEVIKEIDHTKGR